MSNIQHIRLINGEEIIGDIVSEDDCQIWVEGALAVQSASTTSGRSAVVLNKFVPFSNSNLCCLSRQHIICTSELHDVIKQYYHNSLYFSVQSTNSLIEELIEVNTIMEDAIFEQASSSIQKHKGNQTIN